MNTIYYISSRYNILVKNSASKSLIYNSLSGAVAWVDSPLANQLIEYGTEITNNEYFETLIRLRFIIPKECDEFSEILFKKNELIFNNNPSKISFVIAPSLDCNMSCVYCFEKDHRSKKVMNDEVIRQTIEFIKKIVNRCESLKVLNVTWFGGEPCLQKEIIFEISKELISFSSKQNIKYTSKIVTNGLLMNSELTNKFVKLCGIKQAQITLDGMAKTYAKNKRTDVNSFDTVIRNIQDITDFIHVNIRINITPSTKSEILDLTKYLLEDCNLASRIKIHYAPVRAWNNDTKEVLSGCEYIQILKDIHNYVTKKGWQDSLAQQRPIKSILPCGSMQAMNCVIGPDGNLFRCEHNINDDKWRIGDIFNGFLHNYADMQYLLNNIYDKCSTCKAFPICAGGCIADKIVNQNPPFWCDDYIDILRENIDFVVQNRIPS